MFVNIVFYLFTTLPNPVNIITSRVAAFQARLQLEERRWHVEQAARDQRAVELEAELASGALATALLQTAAQEQVRAKAEAAGGMRMRLGQKVDQADQSARRVAVSEAEVAPGEEAAAGLRSFLSHRAALHEDV